MDIGDTVSGIIYLIFIIMSIIYFYLFKKDRLLIHFYFSLIPTFVSIFLLMNYHHYQPIEGAWSLTLLMMVSLAAFMFYWMLYSFWNRK